MDWSGIMHGTDQIAVVIPARYDSSRFPGKPLALIHDKPMILHTCERVGEVPSIHDFWVVTDDDRIAKVVVESGYQARMTDPDCPSGTDRIARSLSPRDPFEYIINVQGDEPFIETETIEAVIQTLTMTEDCHVSTAAVAIRKIKDFNSEHIVKVVFSRSGRALYFSRSPVPSASRAGPGHDDCGKRVLGYKHIGIYGYRRHVLETFSELLSTELEERERLEQLRLLEHDIPIYVSVVEKDSIGVDTPEELELLDRFF
jgi:3-deoxy-manno-octulosonate cytidylyltransferase (CMP-KDO synthetase)